MTWAAVPVRGSYVTWDHNSAAESQQRKHLIDCTQSADWINTGKFKFQRSLTPCRWRSQRVTRSVGVYFTDWWKSYVLLLRASLKSIPECNTGTRTCSVLPVTAAASRRKWRQRHSFTSRSLATAAAAVSLPESEFSDPSDAVYSRRRWKKQTGSSLLVNNVLSYQYLPWEAGNYCDWLTTNT